MPLAGLADCPSPESITFFKLANNATAAGYEAVAPEGWEIDYDSYTVTDNTGFHLLGAWFIGNLNNLKNQSIDTFVGWCLYGNNKNERIILGGTFKFNTNDKSKFIKSNWKIDSTDLDKMVCNEEPVTTQCAW